MDTEEAGYINASSKTTEHLINIVRFGIHVTAGAKGEFKESPPGTFLPFPKWKPLKPEDYSGYLTIKSAQHNLTTETKAILVKLLNNLQIPAFVYSVLMGTAESQ